MVAKLVTEEAALTEIKKLGKGQNVRFAVAFWGTGSADNLKIGASAEAEILCNLQSGCCDPEEIVKLTKMEGVTVLTHRSLHAKVYLSPRRALVGSSNASTNGLALDGETARGWREANLLVNDKQLLVELDKWFTERWAEGKKITQPMLIAARKKWEDRKRRNVIGGHSERKLTLLGSALRSPEQYDDLPIYIALSKATAPKEAVKAVDKRMRSIPKRKLTDAQTAAAFSKVSDGVSFNDRWWIYTDWELKPDRWYIHCDMERTAVWGIARTINPVLSVPFTYEGGTQGNAHVAFKTSMVIPVAGVDLPFPPSDRNVIAKHARKLWGAVQGSGEDGGREMSLANAARRLRRIQEVKKQFKI